MLQDFFPGRAVVDHYGQLIFSSITAVRAVVVVFDNHDQLISATTTFYAGGVIEYARPALPAEIVDAARIAVLGHQVLAHYAR